MPFFTIQKTFGRARVGIIHTAHGDIYTPAFVGAATRASVKALTFSQLHALSSQAILANTLHLMLAPGTELIAKAGGFNAFTGWDQASFTDSGGFQALSLPDCKIDTHGITFKSYLNGDQFRLDPAISMRAQWQIGADIHMAFDQAIDSDQYTAVKDAMLRTHTWLPQNIATHEALVGSTTYPQYLFAVAQGGRFKDLRETSARFVATMPVAGFGIGSLYTTAGDTAALIHFTTDLLPPQKPRHLLGMGSEPRDLFLGVEYGCDTFDCVGPTRMARNGTLYTAHGRINIKNARYRDLFSPVDPTCDCELCQNHSAAYLHHLFRTKEISAKILTSIHNERFVVRTVQNIRQSLLDNCFLSYKEDFLNRYYQP